MGGTVVSWVVTRGIVNCSFATGSGGLRRTFKPVVARKILTAMARHLMQPLKMAEALFAGT